MRSHFHTRRFRRLPGLFALAVLVVAAASPATAQKAKPDGDVQGSSMASILDMEPALYYQFMRYPKFYGDPNMNRATIDGPLLERQYLFGSLSGTRDAMAKNGFVVNVSVTQVVQGTVSGQGNGARYFGSGDIWAALDTGRAGLWSGGLIFGHFDGDWGQSVKGTGALLPLNGDTIMPAAPSNGALSELYLFQGLPNGFAVVAGKVNFSAFADTTFFANNERTQFLYEGLINDPVLGAFVPYTSLGVMVLKQISADVGVAVLAASNNTNALSAGFDKLSADTMTYGGAISWTPKFGGLPGNYSVLVGYTTKDPISFEVSKRYLIEEIIGLVPPAKKDGNYAATFTGSQYFWVDPSARRSDGLPVGVGLFVRAGGAPKDRNLIDRFYSVGIGGNGGLFGRINDNWGIGWAGTHFSSDFRGDAAALGISLDTFENAIEAFYNIALTPAAHLSFHVQNIDSAVPGRNAVVLATRLQLDL